MKQSLLNKIAMVVIGLNVVCAMYSKNISATLGWTVAFLYSIFVFFILREK